MHWDNIESNWQQFKGKAKEQWSALTDVNLDTIAGERDQLSGKIQDFYGVSKDTADAQIAAFAERTRHHKAG
jgi:uncharacterized protein YjbJ (UPF0337 family)